MSYQLKLLGNIKTHAEIIQGVAEALLDENDTLGDEIRALKEVQSQLLDALMACDDAMQYMSEYDIPVNLPLKVKEAIKLARGEA